MGSDGYNIFKEVMFVTIGERIRRLRIEKNMTQEELGSLLGVKKATIQKYENGQIRNLKADTIRFFSDFFGLPPVYFIYDEIPNYGEEIAEQLLKIYLGERGAAFMHNLYKLNLDGLKKLADYCEDLTEIEKYKR